jgi:predicted metalloprotease with PDZ domain
MGRGFTDEELQTAVELIAGKKLDAFFQKYIFGTETIPYNEYFASVGMTMIDKNASTNNPYLGADFRGSAKITSVQRNSPAYNEGLNYGDEILSIDGAKVEDVAKFIQTKKAGDVLEIKVKRDGLEKSFKITLTRNPKKEYALEPVAGASPEQLSLYKKWLYL